MPDTKISLFPDGGAPQANDNVATVRAGANVRVQLQTAAGLILDTDGALAANSDARAATQKAVKSYVDAAVTNLGIGNLTTPGGRLTGTAGVPVVTQDVPNIITLYYTPYTHNVVSLWDGTRWSPITFAETSLSLGTLTAAIGHDVFAYLSGGSLALEILAWTSATARATEVTLQDGRYCKSGDKTRLYLGSFYTSSTTQTQDILIQRFLYNYYNRIQKRAFKSGGTAHTMAASQTTREWNAGTGAPRSEFFVGISDQAVLAYGAARLTSVATDNISLDTAIDAAAVDVTFNQAVPGAALVSVQFDITGSIIPGIGYHYATLRETNFAAAASGTIDQGGTLVLFQG